MNNKLPVDYRDYPTAYVGQPRRFPSEEYGDFPDRANPDAPAGRADANDALDPDVPSGGSTTPVEHSSVTVVPPLPVGPVAPVRPKKSIVWETK